MRTSYINKEEAQVAISEALELKKKFDDVVIIAPYRAQCNLLEELIDETEFKTSVEENGF